jgi:Tfp pilus assembly major pilin PilA
MVIYEYEVLGGVLNLSSTKLPRPWSLWESLSSRKNPHGKIGNQTWDLMISSIQKLWPLDHEAGLSCRYVKWYDMMYLLTAIGLTPSGSSTVHIYIQTVHRTTQKYSTHLHTSSTQNNAAVQYTFTHKQYTEQHSSTVHIYTQTVHRTTQQYSTHLHTNSTQNNTAVQYTFTHK